MKKYWINFINGMTSIFNISGRYDRYDRNDYNFQNMDFEGGFKKDKEALQSDWNKVTRDFNKTLTK